MRRYLERKAQTTVFVVGKSGRKRMNGEDPQADKR